MSTEDITTYLEELNRIARDARITEDKFRREIAQAIEKLKDERAFAYRRLNLMRAIHSAVAGAESEEDAVGRGGAAMLREAGWNGATQAQKEAAERFGPVALAVWNATQPQGEAADEKSVAAELETFERWFADNRKIAFLTLMEREIVELPLVEV